MYAFAALILFELAAVVPFSSPDSWSGTGRSRPHLRSGGWFIMVDSV